MSRLVGTVSRGIRAPIIREGDNIVDVVVDSVLAASKDKKYGFEIQDKDIIAVTEAVVARAQGNYATVDDIANSVKEIFGEDQTIAVVFPILSRNRFAICLRGIAKAAKKIVLVLSFPSDEVGNRLISYSAKPDVLSDSELLTLEDFRAIYGYYNHPFTGIDYLEYYQKLIEDSNASCEIVITNNTNFVYDYTNKILCCDIHTLSSTRQKIRDYFNYKNEIAIKLDDEEELEYYNNRIIAGIDDIMTEPINHNSGYNPQYGLLGSNKATENKVKLFPINCQDIVDKIRQKIYNITEKKVEVMIYGDGCFKDPVGGIWEFADPVVAPAYTYGLAGTPNELKIKYLADSKFANLDGEELKIAIQEEITKKDKNLVGQMASEGTTPRRLTDLIGSLCDLTSGSGDKGTPIVYIQGYFDNYTIE